MDRKTVGELRAKTSATGKTCGVPSRYAHEFPTMLETEDDYECLGACIHCGADFQHPEDAEPPGQAGELCAERQRRHDAFVAAVLGGFSANSNEADGRLMLSLPPADRAPGFAKIAIAIADATMLELAK